MHTARLVFLTAALSAAVLPTTMLAQDISGVWQGTMQAQKELRIVAQISKDGAAFKAVLYSIDQSSEGMASSSIALQDGTVKIIVPGIGGGYEGKLNPAGSHMTGTFHQGNLAIPLNLAKATAAAAWAIPGASSAVSQVSDPDPSVKAATIKTSRPEEPGFGVGAHGHTVFTMRTSLSVLAAFAWGLQEKQIVGGPSWVQTEKYDITAEPDAPGEPDTQQMRAVMQKLLADRFQLGFHHDKRELPVYVLTVLKTGSKLTASEFFGGVPGVGLQGFGRVAASYAQIPEFTSLMENTALDRPIVDQTGLTGHYRFTLNWTPDESQFAGFGRRPPATPAAETLDLFTAIQQQLGLKLEATKAPVEVLVIDRVEKPSAN